MKRNFSFSVMALAALIGMTVTPALAQYPKYKITTLPRIDSPFGSSWFSPKVINDSGKILGTMNNQDYIYDVVSGAMTAIPITGNCMNSAGVVGGFVNRPQNFDRNEAAIWSPVTGTQLLQSVSGQISEVIGINDAGYCVGSDLYNSPVKWNLNGGVELLSFNAVGELGSATGINSQGDIVGSGNFGGAVVWRNGSLTPQQLSTPAGFSSGAGRINDNGFITGGLQPNNGSDEVRAGIWLPNGEFRYVAPNGGRAGVAGINRYNVVAGSRSNILGAAQRAFVWTQANGYSELNSLRDPGSLTWNMLTSNSINNNGVIVGIGIKSGVFNGYMATPVPEVSFLHSSFLMMVGLIGLSRRKKKAA